MTHGDEECGRRHLVVELIPNEDREGSMVIMKVCGLDTAEALALIDEMRLQLAALLIRESAERN